MEPTQAYDQSNELILISFSCLQMSLKVTMGRFLPMDRPRQERRTPWRYDCSLLGSILAGGSVALYDQPHSGACSPLTVMRETVKGPVMSDQFILALWGFKIMIIKSQEFRISKKILCWWRSQSGNSTFF